MDMGTRTPGSTEWERREEAEGQKAGEGNERGERVGERRKERREAKKAMVMVRYVCAWTMKVMKRERGGEGTDISASW